MKVLIDSNSLLSLVRYYFPFDKNSLLFDFIKVKIENGDIIIIDKVYDECSYFAKGIVIKNINYLADKDFRKQFNIPFNTTNIIAPSPAKFLNLLNNQFVNSIVRKQSKITDTEFENQKSSHLETADMKLIILALNLIKDNVDEEIFIVTEETESSNDNKLFKKIPSICKELSIKTITLPELLGLYEEIKVEFK